MVARCSSEQLQFSLKNDMIPIKIDVRKEFFFKVPLPRNYACAVEELGKPKIKGWAEREREYVNNRVKVDRDYRDELLINPWGRNYEESMLEEMIIKEICINKRGVSSVKIGSEGRLKLSGANHKELEGDIIRELENKKYFDKFNLVGQFKHYGQAVVGKCFCIDYFNHLNRELKRMVEENKIKITAENLEYIRLDKWLY